MNSSFSDVINFVATPIICSLALFTDSQGAMNFWLFWITIGGLAGVLLFITAVVAPDSLPKKKLKPIAKAKWVVDAVFFVLIVHAGWWYSVVCWLLTMMGAWLCYKEEATNE